MTQTKTLTIRITYKDYVELKRLFPAERGESASSWFHRVKEWFEK